MLEKYYLYDIIGIKKKRATLSNLKMAPGRAPWREAETVIKELFPMYKLTVDGLNQAMIKLMVNK